MDEILKYYEDRGIPIPLTLSVRAIETFGYIIENNYPLEDLMYEEKAIREYSYPEGNSDIPTPDTTRY